MYTDTSIIEQAKQIRLKYGQDEAPIDIEKICREMGISVIRMDMSALEERATRPISGLIYWDRDENKKRIFVNKNDPRERQTFTIAHELGHNALHLHDDENGVVISFRGLKNAKEREADRFAAEILMPKDLVKREYDSVPFPTTTYLAGIFGVSELAMRYRLQDLGLSDVE